MPAPGAARRRDARLPRRLVAAAAALAAGAGLLGGCGGGAGSPPPSTIVSVPTRGGTVTWAEAPDARPDYIFPLAPAADYTAANRTELQQLLYRPLYWFGDDNEPTVDYAESLADQPVFSDHDQTVTITLKGYTWSDGEPVDARDVEFWMNLLEVEKANWAEYLPGELPDNVISVSAPDGPTGKVVVFQLNQSYNPTWFLYNELSQITPLPIAWDKTSASAPTPLATDAGLPDTTPAGAVAVYEYLTAAAQEITTYSTSPLWGIVDGPWTLRRLTTTGRATFVPNPEYTGPDKPVISSFVEEPFSSEEAELADVERGPDALTVGYVPTENRPDVPELDAEGYTSSADYLYGISYLPLNFDNPTVGKLFDQLYVRQVLQTLINERGWVRRDDDRLATPTHGPVPIEPSSSFVGTFERSNPYPFDVATARALLQAHGWDVVADGLTTCADPGDAPDQCGAGIAKGAGLSFDIDVSSELPSLAASMASYTSVASEVGIQLTITSESLAQVLATAVACAPSEPDCTWEIADWGGGWTYSPDYYATGERVFASGAPGDVGSYASPQADKLITSSMTAGPSQSQSSLDAYQDYIAEQLPVLYQPILAGSPAPGTNLVSSSLAGVEPNAFGNLDPEDWYFLKEVVEPAGTKSAPIGT